MGTASGRYPNSNGMEAFGKTGTASDEKDLWFVGGTPYYVTAVWWGYDAPYDMTKTLSKQQAKTRTCVTAWKALMEQAQADLPYKAFPTSAGVVERRYCTPTQPRRLLPLPRTQTMLCPPSRSSPPIPVRWIRNKGKNRTFSPLC